MPIGLRSNIRGNHFGLSYDPKRPREIHICLWYLYVDTPMTSKPVSSDLAQAPSFASRLFSFANQPRVKVWLWPTLFILLVIGFVYIEIQTSLLQSWFFTRTNEQLSYQLATGRSAEIAFPRSAPFDDRRGYSKVPAFQTRLEAHGYQVSQQVRQSEKMVGLIKQGISPPYLEPPETGLDIRGADSMPLFRHAQSEFLFSKIEDIPPPLVKALLFLEDRDLDDPASPWQNPAIEWDRLFKAALLYIASKFDIETPMQGGSTLAVQLEKFRHSPHGRTESPVEKYRQLMGASLKAYRQGWNTRAWRERIIVDYFNTVPLAAAPGYGEIHGLGEGLFAWFGMQLAEVAETLKASGMTPAKLRAYKHALALLISVRAPSVYLVEERASLEEKVDQFTRLMARAGIIDWDFAAALQETPIKFIPSAPLPPQPSSGKNKAANAIRTTLMESLGVYNVYDLNRLHLEVGSTIDVPLQKTITDFLQSLSNPNVIKARGLDGERLLENADPKRVIYSVLLVEPTPDGNLVRVQADNLPGPFDFNKSVKLELGSTAKLRTLTHYLELIAELHNEVAPLDAEGRKKKLQQARDPLTKWAVETLQKEKSLTLEAFLDLAMDRKYSASPYETFFTGGGVHHFENFEREDDKRILPLRAAFRNSTNLVFIRLMRDIVSYHRARLAAYNSDAVLADATNPDRQRMLQEIAEEESRIVIRRAYQAYHGQTEQQIVARLLGSKKNTERRLTILFFAWQIGSDEQALAAWLKKNQVSIKEREVSKLFRGYQNPRLTLVDYAYLLSLHPLDLWCASEYRKNADLAWETLLANSSDSRRQGSAWLLNPRNRRAQDIRLRIRMEKEAFARMVPYWQRLGFPFKTMVPSYATAIGNSSDRPVALAELIGILVNDGVRRPNTELSNIQFARGTPYETVFERKAEPGQQVLAPEVARAVRKAMAAVVESGTARRLNGVFKLSDGNLITVGGKTGSGDNRVETFNRWGGVTSSRATNRTAAFVFYIGDRYFGVITAYVEGREAEKYHFTSSLPVTILKLLAPTINAKLDKNIAQGPDAPAENRGDGAPHKVDFKPLDSISSISVR
jgi:membrane peptidoglycan carboxypeptidase